VELVSVIADKVCHAKFNPQMLYQITLDAIKLLNDKETITIIVSPKLVDSIQKMVPNFRSSIQSIQTLKIVEDNSLAPDGVIVETPNTRLDSRISAQIAELTQKMLTGDSGGMGQK
jgi:flagellar biosynthesis/type III secretory pathway protein FliH